MNPDISPWILLEDDGLIVVNKPRGMPTAGDHMDQPGSVQFALMRHYRRKIWAVHQLDKLTSGLNLFVRRKALVAHWSGQLKGGQKRYLALCHGQVAHDHFYIKAPIGWVAAQRKHGVFEGGKAAKTEVHVLARGDEVSLIRATIHTGRTHQIRVHLSHQGHPLIGDPLYGLTGGRTDGGILALHAHQMILPDRRVLEAPIDDSWAALLAAHHLDMGPIS